MSGFSFWGKEMLKLEAATGEVIKTKFWTFPAGERGVTIEDIPSLHEACMQSSLMISMNFQGSDDIIDLGLLTNAIRHERKDAYISLACMYFPYGRQDRVTAPGEAFSLQAIAGIINSCNFNDIIVWDSHSDVLQGLFPPGKLTLYPQHEVVESLVRAIIKPRTGTAVGLVSPDGGALKKIYKLSQMLSLPVLEASKTRDVSTGNITGVKINAEELTNFNTLIVVDDICDGGRTFIELGNEIRKIYEGNLFLVVTHGIFSKGRAVFDGIFDGVYAANNMDI